MLALERNDEGNWEVLVQVVGLERIPDIAGVKKQVAARRDEGPSVPTLAATSVGIS